MIIFWLLHNLR